MPRFKLVPVAELEVDGRYQRPLDQPRVSKIVREFDGRKFGALEISQRNGHASVFDGQHRLAAALKIGMDKVPCLVHAGLSPEEEAELFVALQKERRGINQVDRFRARVFTGEPVAVAIQNMVDYAGYEISNTGPKAGELSRIRAVTSLERVYARGNLAETLGMLNALWVGDAKSTDGGLIEGLSIVLEGYGHRFDDAVIDRLRATPPLTILRRSIGHGGGGSSKGVMVASEIRKAAGLRGAPKKRQAKVAA